MSELINNTIQVEIPSGMHLLSLEEKKKVLGNNKEIEETFCLHNAQQHTIINICYKKRPLLVGRLAPLKAQAEATENNVKKLVKDFEHISSSQREIDGVPFECFTFGYTIKEIHQFTEYDLCTQGNYFYTIQCIYRDGYKEYAEKKMEELVNTIHFIKK